MKSIIPFSKELDFSTKLSEITSISLEREFFVKDFSIEGNLFVTGEYKSHEVSANVIPFSFKIPFSIEIPDDMDEQSIKLEINDFAYDTVSENQIRVNIELELDGDIIEKESIEEEIEEKKELEVDTEEILKFMENENRQTEEKSEEIIEQTVEEEPKKIEEPEKIEEPKIEEPKIEEESVLEEETKELRDTLTNTTVEENEALKEESEEIILENVTIEDEYTTYHIHMVKEGESIETVCTMYGSKLNLLTDYNDVSNLTVGDKLIIPECDES